MAEIVAYFPSSPKNYGSNPSNIQELQMIILEVSVTYNFNRSHSDLLNLAS